MKKLKNISLFAGLLAVLCAIPARAQIANQVKFEAPFAFYAGNALMPAGSYTVRPDDTDDDLIVIQSADDSHAAFLECMPRSKNTPAKKTEVTFKKYGDSEFLSRVSIEGQEGVKVLPSRAQKNAAKAAKELEHSLSATNAS
jgi:hypothetical protein